MNITLSQNDPIGVAHDGIARNARTSAFRLVAGFATLLCLPLCLAAAERELMEKQLQQVLRRFPDADLNKDGKLTIDEFREFRRKIRPEGTTLSSPSSAAATSEAPATAPKGQRIFICGHSFHVGIAEGLVRGSALVNPLQEVAQSAGIVDQKLVGAQFPGGSQVIKHWNLPDDRDKAKEALRTGEVDVLTLSPKGQLPDEGIENFTALALEYNSNVRIFVQESWASFDSPGVSRRRKDFKNQDRDIIKVEELRKAHATFFKELAALVQGLNDKLKEKEKRQVVYLVPAGPAVLTLREKVAEGKAPGVAKQSELFHDATGHGKGAVTLLTTYCFYAAIYGRSPVGLPVPSTLQGQVTAEHEEKLNRLLQEIAWEAVTNEPLTGVKK